MTYWILISLLPGILFAALPARASSEIVNPYHEKRAWKVWRSDPSPVKKSVDETISPPPEEARIHPRETGGDAELFLKYESGPDPEGKFAGIWDDAYSSLDNGHSYMRGGWSDGGPNKVTGIRESIIRIRGGPLHDAGINFTSKSTTGMGHDTVNEARRMAHMERDFYFSDILFSAPAHISYMETKKKGAVDEYQALQPIFYNSIGSSGSETHALSKMILAGGYLDPKLKTRLKINGLYPSTMLYIWKAALPYDVPFEHELRHRVAYFSLGDGSSYDKTAGTSPKVAREAYYYDDAEHMRRMIEIAKSLEGPPPEVLLTVATDEGCKPVYYLKKTVLVHHKPFKPVKLRISLEDSYDLDGRPLAFRLKLLYGEKRTTIEQVGDQPVYDITVPYNLKLPQGRTSIIAVANNGFTDGNPAIINVFRQKRESNERPRMKELPRVSARPGQEVRLELQARDPEMFPVSFYKVLGPGRIEDKHYVWRVPEDHPGGDENAVIVVSDGTAGNSYNAVNATIAVKKL